MRDFTSQIGGLVVLLVAVSTGLSLLSRHFVTSQAPPPGAPQAIYQTPTPSQQYAPQPAQRYAPQPAPQPVVVTTSQSRRPLAQNQTQSGAPGTARSQIVSSSSPTGQPGQSQGARQGSAGQPGGKTSSKIRASQPFDIVGVWLCLDPATDQELRQIEFRPDGSYELRTPMGVSALKITPGNYRLQGNVLSLVYIHRNGREDVMERGHIRPGTPNDPDEFIWDVSQAFEAPQRSYLMRR
jgi:hypothetical protein